MITICNLSYEKPKHPFDVRVHRKHILGNPFIMKDERMRDDVCDKYERWFNKCIINLTPELDRLLALYRKHGALRLFCWCAPKRCHAETIKAWLENHI